MLRKQDNEWLFYFAKRALYNLSESSAERSAVMAMKEQLPDEMLAKITRLDFTPDLYDRAMPKGAFEGLKGLEDFENLEELVIDGVDDFWGCANIMRNARFHAAGLAGMSHELELAEWYYNYFLLEDEDLEEIYKLPKLRKLSLNNQRNLTKIDFSEMPELYQISMKNCTRLESVKKLENLDCFFTSQGGEIEFWDGDVMMDFSGCVRLKNVEGFKDVVKGLKIFEEHEGWLQPLLRFPTVTYAHMAKRLREADLQNIANSHLVSWTDIGGGGVCFETPGWRMKLLHERAEDVLRIVCASDENAVERLSSVYRWICENVKYDDEGLKEDDNKEERLRKEKHGQWNRNINIGSDKTRSTYAAMFSNKAVCVGVSHLFNYLAAELGYTACPCECRGAKEKSEHAIMVDANHQMSKVYVRANGGQEVAYYLDPTWDLGRDRSEYFMLTKSEMEARNHEFTLEDAREKDAESLQEIIKAAGLDKTHREKYARPEKTKMAALER